MNVLDVIIILAYFVGMIVLGLIANKKQTGVDDYYLGGRSMGALKIGALWMAGWIGGSSVIGTSSNSYSMGITGVWYVGEIAIGCVLFALVMAKPIKRVSEELRNITFPELICARYDQKNSTMASITTILAMIGYTAAQFVAGASILNVLTGWNLGVCYILAAVVIVFYVSTGGLLAVTYTDIVQMALLLLGIVVLAVPLVGAQLHKMGANLVTDLPASFFDLGAWGWPTILALGLSTIMLFFTSMDSYTRCIAARDAKTARTGTIYAAVLVFIIAGASTFLGMAGKLILPDLSSSNNVIAALVVEFFPHGLKGLGRIGQSVARKAQAFDMEVIAYDPFLPPAIAENLGVKLVDFDTLLAESDVLSLHMNLTEENYHMFNKEAFMKCKKHPIIVNEGRGPLICDEDLVWALDNGYIRGAALDMVESEDPDLNTCPLVGRDDVLLTPHSGYYSDTSNYLVAKLSMDNALYYVAGEYDKVKSIRNGVNA